MALLQKKPFILSSLLIVATPSLSLFLLERNENARRMRESKREGERKCLRGRERVRENDRANARMKKKK